MFQHQRKSRQNFVRFDTGCESFKWLGQKYDTAFAMGVLVGDSGHLISLVLIEILHEKRKKLKEEGGWQWLMGEAEDERTVEAIRPKELVALDAQI